MTSHYEALGGETAVRELVSRFYQEMDSSPSAKVIRAMHPKSLQSSEEKLFMFLSGWFGGPPLFIEKFGHPRLRARHLPFTIGADERDQWIACMEKALSKISIPAELHSELSARFFELATHMINQEQGASSLLKMRQ